MNGGRPSNFFKVLVENFALRLSIPKAYIEEMPEELSGTVILHGPSGNSWHVRLSKTSKGTYLAGGWEAFVKDHSLTEGEFLLFTHVRSRHFNVKIFGRNACEREDAFTVQAPLNLPRVNEDTFIFEASHGLTSLKERKKCQSPRRDAGNIASTSKLKALGENADVAAFRFTSRFPYFHTQIKRYSLVSHHYITVPQCFVQKHLPEETRSMFLQTVDGIKWIVKFCFSCPSRISVGWKSFASKNHIKEDDFLVFELVEEDTFLVHFFRC